MSCHHSAHKFINPEPKTVPFQVGLVFNNQWKLCNEDLLYCSQDGCTSTIQNHAWGRIKAEGWFFQMNRDAWCPNHIPDWVESWRKSRDKVQNGGSTPRRKYPSRAALV